MTWLPTDILMMWVGVGIDVGVGVGVVLGARVEFSVRCIAPTDTHISW
jgi:hypothetical protein